MKRTDIRNIRPTFSNLSVADYKSMSIATLAQYIIFLFGLCIGSFLNVVIYRLEKEQSFVKGRSYCPHCKHQLSWLDLVPVASFLFLKGKCRYCHKRISTQYPIVELATGLIFLFIFWFSGFYWTLGIGVWELVKLCFMLYVASSLIVIFVYDLKYYLIPDSVLFPAILITFTYRFFQFLNFSNFIVAALIASGCFLFIFLISKGNWMGFGDVKLAILLGLLLGFPNILVGLFLSFFFGAIIGVALIYLNKKGLKSEVPFAPFLIAGTFIAIFLGQEIVNWYMHFSVF